MRPGRRYDSADVLYVPEEVNDNACLTIMIMNMIHPHQRCGYSDSPFARMYFFHTAGFRNRFEGMESVCTHTKTEHHIKKTLFSYGKMFWGRQTGWKTRPGSAGIDNEAHWSCKRRVAATFVQNDRNPIQNLKIKVFNFLEVRKSDVFPPGTNASLLTSRFLNKKWPFLLQ